MSYWIQEHGHQKGGIVRPDWKFIHCDKESDVKDLPTKEKLGKYQECDPHANELVKQGDQALVLETSTVYEMGYDTGWNKL